MGIFNTNFEFILEKVRNAKKSCSGTINVLFNQEDPLFFG